jgi:putative acetyltransferase
MPAIRLESPDQPDVRALIDALDAYQKPLYPLSSFHGIDLAALCRPEMRFFVARDDAGVALGCAGIWVAEVDGVMSAEIKRMFVTPAARGMGLGQALLARLIDAARACGAQRLLLETGTRQPEAQALYERAGFSHCGPFGDYQPDPHSLFMVKPL